MSRTLPLIVDTNWLAARLDDPQLRLLDATTILQVSQDGDTPKRTWLGREVYNSGHIPGAVFADIPNELSDPNGLYTFTAPTHAQFSEQIGKLGVGDGTYVVVYDQGTGTPSYWASRVWWLLRLAGFDQVAVLDGGFKKWSDEGRPVSTEQGEYPPAVFSGQRRPELIANADDVKLAIGDDATVIVDSLLPASYSGEKNSYGRSGHIPTSINVPFSLHLNPDNTVKSDEEVEQSLQSFGLLDADKKVITYCGGGIAATWNALLLARLGKDAAVYDGSLTEWAADPSLPLVTEEA